MLHFPCTSLLFPLTCPSSPWGTHISGRLGEENNLELGLALRMPASEVARIRGFQSLLAVAPSGAAQTLDGLAAQWRGEGGCCEGQHPTGRPAKEEKAELPPGPP